MMVYDNTSMNGEIIAEEYLEQGNPLNPESPFGYFIYKLIGGSFDKMDDMTNNFLLDCNVLSTSAESLDKFWGKDLGLPRPTITDETPVERLLTDDEYRIYLYVRNSRLMTVEDLLSVFNNCMSLDEYGVRLEKVPTGYLALVDHNNYTPAVTDTSDIAAQTGDTSLDIVTDFANDAETHKWHDRIHPHTDFHFVLYVPSQNWDANFLSLLEEYASIKGNVFIREYSI